MGKFRARRFNAQQRRERLAEMLALSYPRPEIADTLGMSVRDVEKFATSDEGDEALAKLRSAFIDRAALLLAVAEEHAPALMRKTIEEAMQSSQDNPKAWDQRKWLLSFAAQIAGGDTHLHLGERNQTNVVLPPGVGEQIADVLELTQGRRRTLSAVASGDHIVVDAEEIGGSASDAKRSA